MLSALFRAKIHPECGVFDMGVMSERCLHGVGLRLIWQVCWEFSPTLPLPVVLHTLPVVSLHRETRFLGLQVWGSPSAPSWGTRNRGAVFSLGASAAGLSAPNAPSEHSGVLFTGRGSAAGFSRLSVAGAAFMCETKGALASFPLG